MGPHRASNMDGPDARYHLRGNGCHKATISIAIAGGARGGEVRQLGNFLNRADHVGQFSNRLSKTGNRLSKTDGQRGWGNNLVAHKLRQ
jgi:hypothetical protein